MVERGVTMKKIRLAFLWHMHQPYYKDDMQNEYKMPWVFLHAIKDYYELPYYLSKFKSIKATFNLVPSLIEQLEEYEKGFINDSFLSSVKKEVSLLTPKEKLSLCETLFFANLKTMIHPLARYRQLHAKKTSYKDTQSFADSIGSDEILDLEVLFLLSWCSNALRENSTIVQNLIKKAQNFSEFDKAELFAELFAFLGKIIPFYKKLQDEGKIEVATTPFYHPILPLLLDKNAAKEADRNAQTPKIFANFRSDALVHVEMSIAKYEETFGKKPNTFWPSEGSVSKEVLELLSKAGVKYVGADEDVLFKSLESRYRFDIYKRYTVGKENTIGVLFRDKAISDLVGFTYSGKDAKESVADFIGRLKELYHSIGFEAVVPIILDGENAWEYYEHNAKDFFETLYMELEKLDWCETLTFSEVFAAKHIESSRIETIKPGSWIYGTFSTWMGHEEKNRAWELLSETKIAFDEVKGALDAASLKVAQKELMVAEGSDWFWWYGDDHYTPQANEFDELFRKHLLNVFRIIGKAPPARLFESINKTKAPKVKQKPKNYIAPIIDGKMTDFYEWLGAGSVDLDTEFSAMDSSGFHFEKLYWGFDEENIYFAISGKFAELIDSGYDLCVELVSSKAIKIKVPFSSKKYKMDCVEAGIGGYTQSSVGEVFELSLPKSCLECGCDKLLEASFEIQKSGKVIEKAPLYGSLQLEVNEKFLEDWYI